MSKPASHIDFPNLPALMRDTAHKMGNRTAMRKKRLGIWHDITWQEYLDQTECVASALIHFGLKPGQAVSIIGDNAPEWVFADMGIQFASGVSVGIYATNAAEQCEYVINHSESVFLFVQNEEQLDKWLQIRKNTPQITKVVVWDTKGLRNFEDSSVLSFDAFIEIGREQRAKNASHIKKITETKKPDDNAILVYTSGTTGLPKAAILTHRNLIWMARAILELDSGVDISENDEVLSFLPLCHIFERLFSVYIQLTAGYVVNYIESPDTVADNMREISPTIGYAVPRIWEKYYSAIFINMTEATRFKKLVYFLALYLGQRYAELFLDGGQAGWRQKAGFWLAKVLVFNKLRDRLGLDRMKVAFSGAAPISPDVIRFYHSIGLKLVEGYGQTEGSGVTTGANLNAIRVGTVGKPLDGVEVRLAEDGEILVKSPGVFKGYFKNEEETSQALKNGWLHSGDIGEFDKEGFLRIIDRKKDLIITAGGKNIAPQYIENKLKFSPYINDAIVIGDKRKYLTALIILDEDNTMKFAQDHKLQFSTYAELTKHPEINQLINKEINKVNKTLSRVENVRKFTILPKKLYEEDGEVTPTMKVKRNKVNDLYKDLIESMY